MQDERGAQGVLYVALGVEFLAMALASATTLRRMSPELGVALVTNVGPRDEARFTWTTALVDHWQYIEVDARANRETKLLMYELSPFRRTLYLDADTEVLADISPMFAWLEHADIALHLQPRGARPGAANINLDQEMLVGDLPHWNSGVILFRRTPNVRAFFSEWQEEFARLDESIDQAALASTMMRSTARVLTFDMRWNCPPSSARKYDWEHLGGVRILHYMRGMPDPTLQACLGIFKRLTDEPGVADDSASIRLARERLVQRATQNCVREGPRGRSVRDRLRAALRREGERTP